MKKVLSLLCAAGLTVSLAACGSTGSTPSATPEESTPVAEPVELNVFAAASLTESLNEIQTLYTDVAPNVTLLFTTLASGTLQTQIEQGADADLFISAGQNEMNALDATYAGTEFNPLGLDFILSNTRIDLLGNQLVLAVPAGNPAGITSFEDLITDRVTMLAIGAPASVPAGMYAQETLTALGLWDTLNAENKLTLASSVKEVTAQVTAGSVDAGIIYLTDANAADLEVVAIAPTDSHSPIVYPAAVLTNSHAPQAAEDFLAFLTGPEATAVFESYGFSAP